MNRQHIAYICYGFMAIFFFSAFSIGTIGFVISVTFLAIGVYNIHKYENDRVKDARLFIDEFKSKHNFDDFDTNHDGLQGIFLEMKNNRIGLLNRNNLNSDFTIEYIDFKDISDVHIIKNESTVMKSSKSDLIGKSFVGGLALGGVGAVIGAVSSDKKLDEKLHTLKLQIVVDDIVNPIRNITIINTPEGIKQSNVFSEEIFKISDKWFKRITLIIKNNDNKMVI